MDCLVVVVLALGLVRSASSQSFIYKGCSQETYSDSTYDNNVQAVLGTLVSEAHDNNYYNASVGSASSSVVYGLYQCRSDLGGDECQKCVQNAQAQLTQACVRTRGAKIQLDGCSLHYDRVNFFGQTDNAFIYKTCSGTLSGGADFYKHLNAVLSGLQTGSFIDGKGFRLANSGDSHTGYVHGLAQCQGDISLQDCSTCINSAVQRLRDVCASAVSGQAYLGKCYARYAQDAFYREHSSNDDDDDDDEAGKTVAIILGLLAGVALIVVFLSFLKHLLKEGKH